MAAFNERMLTSSPQDDENTVGVSWTSKPVDLVHLAKYTLGDSALESEILKLFSKHSLVYLEQIENAETTREWLEAAHTLKGSAKSIGAWLITELAEKAEQIDALNAPDERVEILGQMKTELSEVIAYIDDLLE